MRLDFLKRLDDREVSFDQPVADCDFGAAEKSRQQLAHLKTADHKVKHQYRLAFTDLIGPLTPEVFRGYKYVSKISDEHTR